MLSASRSHHPDKVADARTTSKHVTPARTPTGAAADWDRYGLKAWIEAAKKRLATLVNLFLKLSLANQEATMDGTRSHAAGPTKATPNASEVVIVESALCHDLLKAGAISMKEIDKLIGELQRAYD